MLGCLHSHPVLHVACRPWVGHPCPKAKDIKERINKWDFIKIKSFCTAKENSSKVKREPTVWENIFANDTSDKDLILKKYKEHIWWQYYMDFSSLKKIQCFGDQTLVWGIIGKYIFPYGWFPFHFPNVFFSHAEAFYFDVRENDWRLVS